MRSLAAFAVCALTACSGALPPTWEQPGLAGAVRPEMGGVQPGAMAPDFELDGKKLSSLRGSWVVLHFTASWCPYCDSEVSHLGELADAYGARGVKVVLVDEKEDEAHWHAYAKDHVAASVMGLRDGDGAAALKFAPPRAQMSFMDRSQVVLDSTLIIDPEGVVRLFLLPDSAHFDPTFVAVRRELDRLIAADIVHVALASDGCAVVAKLDVAPGYHVMSHTPSEPQFIPTRVEVTATDAELGDPRYPAGATYEGQTSVVVPCKDAAAADAREHGVVATVFYQA